jgi:mono/diheme cytochrome c family protein
MPSLASRWLLTCLLGAAGLVSACGREARDDAMLARTGPEGADDPRIAYFDSNAYQVGQGGRYAAWYGCNSCHGQGAEGDMDLGDASWRHGGRYADIYRSIADRHSAAGQRFGERIPVQQLWQIAAYVHNLEGFGTERIRRQGLDQAGEPEGSRWSGALR